MPATGDLQSLSRSAAQQSGPGSSESSRGQKRGNAAPRGHPNNSLNKSRSSQNSKASGQNGVKSKRQTNNQRSSEKNTKKINANKNPTGLTKESANGKVTGSWKRPEKVPEQSDTPMLGETKHLAKMNADPIQQYTAEEISATGPVFADPSSMGFIRKSKKTKPRPVPRYMYNQPRLLAAPPFQQDPWDTENQRKMAQMEKESNGTDYQGIYEEFQKMRDIERKKMEELGLVDAENITKDLNDAIYFRGTCLDMCPIFERTRRSLENNVKALEKDPNTQKISKDRAVKAFSRPAAGQPPPMPSDVRPPEVLQRTLNYLVDDILPKLPDAHSFIWDRTRSIRQDFIYQNYYGPEAIDCNERIVRIHLLSLHVMAGSDVEYSQQQELEQFNKALQTLTEMYQDVRNHGGVCPNEAEFRAYHLLSHFRDPELERELQTLPDTIYKDPKVQLAIRFRTVMSQNNIVERNYTNTVGASNLFVEFFRLVYSRNTPLLMAFLLETHFNEIRFYALKSLSRSYHTKGKAFSGNSLKEMLGFDTLDNLEDFVSYYEIDTLHEDDQLLIDLCNKEKLESKYKLNSLQDKPKRSQAYSTQLNSRLSQLSIQSLINSGFPNVDLQIPPSKINKILQATIRHDSTRQPSQNLQNNVEKPIVDNTKGLTVIENQPRFAPSTNSTPSNNANMNVSGSFNLTDFLKHQKRTTFSENGTFGSKSDTPAFDFTAKSSLGSSSLKEPKDVELPNRAKFDPNSTEVAKSTGFGSSVNFKFEEPKHSQSNKVEFSNRSLFEDIKYKEKEKEKDKAETGISEKTPESRQKIIENKNVLELKPLSDVKSSSDEKSGLNKLVSMPTLASSTNTGTATTKLVKSPELLSKAIESIYANLLHDSISQELLEVLPKIIKNHQRTEQKRNFVMALSEELFSAFVSEQIYQTLLRAVAKNHYEKGLKRKFIQRLIATGKMARALQEEKKQRMRELQSTQFKVPTLKRQHSIHVEGESPVKRRETGYLSRNSSYLRNESSTYDDVQKLWSALDLKRFVDICAGNTKIRPYSKVAELKCLILVENWKSSHSKWLNTKFGFKVSEDKLYYIKRVESEKLVVSFESLPKSNLLKEMSFRNTPFYIFECGLFDASHLKTYSSLENKLARDSSILLKVVQICDRYCLFNIQILVLVWDITHSEANLQHQEELFQVKKLIEADNCVKNISICNMSSGKCPEDDLLQQSLTKMAQNFDASLTKRGQRKRTEAQNVEEKRRKELEQYEVGEEESSADIAREHLEAKEASVLKRVRSLQARRSLLTRAVSNRGIDLTNTSAVFGTPNASHANNTLINYNNSFVGNNTILPTRDFSILGSFGNASVLEESTPSGSPRSKPQAQLPKKIQDLRELTASIRAKYKR